MRVTMTGATGSIGSQLVAALLERGDEVTVLSRSAASAHAKLGSEVTAFSWDPVSGPPPAEALAGRDAVVNLAGESIAQRWTAQAKRSITASRVDTTRHLVQALAALPADERPGVLVSGSAHGYYGDRRDPATEQTPQGTGFLAEVSGAWESEARGAEAHDVRVVLIRTGDVLLPGGNDGLLGPLTKLTKFGLGGPVGGGRQPVPWVHVDDVVGLILLALDDSDADGPINAVAPGIVSQKQFASALGQALGRPAFAPAPGFAVRLLLGEMADLVLHGANVQPAAAAQLGYHFDFPGLTSALDDVLSRDG